MTKDIAIKENRYYRDWKEAHGFAEQEVKDRLSHTPAIVRKYMSHLAKAPGKYIRAKSLLICAAEKDGRVSDRAVRAAAAIEIFHLATLVHDDVIDDSPVRRGIESLQKKFGKRTAVICGDYLLSLSLQMISEIYRDDQVPGNRIFRLLGRLTLGELKQHINNGNYSLSVIEYFRIISGKTAALFEITFFMGAYLAGTDTKTLRKIAVIGRYIGMIFQLTDDCMDYESTEKIARKPVRSDFEQDVITLPLIYALKNDKGLSAKASRGGLTIKAVHESIRKTGSLEFTREIAARYREKSLKILEPLELDKEKKADLKSIIDKAYRIA